MTAHVVVRASLARLVAQHDDALTGDLDNDVVARLLEARLAPHADPVTREDPLLLVGEHLGRRVVAARQRPRALAIALDRLEECHRISRAAFRPAAPGIPPPGCVPEPH